MDDVRAVRDLVSDADDRLRDALRRKAYTPEQRVTLFGISEMLGGAAMALHDLMPRHGEDN